MFAPSHRARTFKASYQRDALSRSKQPVKPSGIVTLGVIDEGVMYAVVVVRVGVELFPTPVDHRIGIGPIEFFSFIDRDVTQCGSEKGFGSFFELHGYLPIQEKVVTGECRFAPPAEERRVSAGGFFAVRF